MHKETQQQIDVMFAAGMTSFADAAEESIHAVIKKKSGNYPTATPVAEETVAMQGPLIRQESLNNSKRRSKR